MSVLQQPFEWGQTDCNTIALEWASIISGLDLISDIRGRYHSLEEAKTFSVWKCETLLTRLLDAGFGIVADSPRPGDIAVVEGPCFGMGHVIVRDGLCLSANERDGATLRSLDLLEGHKLLRLSHE